MHPEDAPQWSYVEQEDFIYDTEIDSRGSFDEDEDFGEETEEVLIDSQKTAASDDLAERSGTIDYIYFKNFFFHVLFVNISDN